MGYRNGAERLRERYVSHGQRSVPALQGSGHDTHRMAPSSGTSTEGRFVMAVYSGSLGLQGIYLGSTPVQKIYLGTTEIWSGASPVQFVDANATGVNSVPIPTHAIGELIVLCAVNDYATQAPVKPSAAGTVPNWVYIDNTADTGITTSYFKATATNHTSGTWTNTSRMIAVVLRGQNAATPIGGHASQRGTSSGPSTAPAITLDHTDGSSVLLYFPRPHHPKQHRMGRSPNRLHPPRRVWHRVPAGASPQHKGLVYFGWFCLTDRWTELQYLHSCHC